MRCTARTWPVGASPAAEMGRSPLPTKEQPPVNTAALRGVGDVAERGASSFSAKPEPNCDSGLRVAQAALCL